MNQKIKQKQEVSINPLTLCMDFKTPQKRQSSISRDPTNHLSKYMRMISSFKQKHISKKKRYATNQTQTPDILTLEDNLVHMPSKKASTPVVKASTKNNMLKNLQLNPENSRQMLSKSSEVKNLSKEKKLSFPSISFMKVEIPTNKRYSLGDRQPKTHNSRFKTEAAIKPLILIKSQRKSGLSRVSLNKVEGAPNGNLLQFSRLKPTEQHFYKLQNVRIAQKLLLMQPSKDLRKSEQIKFYNKQKTYRQRISQSTLIKKSKMHKESKMEDNGHIRIKSEWVF